MPGIVAVPRSQEQAKSRGSDSGDALNRGQAKSITDLVEQEGVTVAYVCRLLPLTCLAPDVVEAILDGRQPKGLRLAEVLGNGPLAWDEQRMSWGTRFADGEVVTGLRTDDRGPGTNDHLLNAPEPRPLAGSAPLRRNQPSSPISSASRIQSSGANRVTSSRPGSLPARGA